MILYDILQCLLLLYYYFTVDFTFYSFLYYCIYPGVQDRQKCCFSPTTSNHILRRIKTSTKVCYCNHQYTLMFGSLKSRCCKIKFQMLGRTLMVSQTQPRRTTTTCTRNNQDVPQLPVPETTKTYHNYLYQKQPRRTATTCTRNNQDVPQLPVPETTKTYHNYLYQKQPRRTTTTCTRNNQDVPQLPIKKYRYVSNSITFQVRIHTFVTLPQSGKRFTNSQCYKSRKTNLYILIYKTDD